MPTKKRTYYRNWYQESLKQEQRRQNYRGYEASTYRSPSMVSTVDPTQYKANHNVKTSQYPQKREGTMELSLNGESMGNDVLRGIMLGIPLICAIFVIMYYFGLFPATTSQSTLSQNTELSSYVIQYEDLMTLHNSVNKSVTEQLSKEDLSSLYKSELGKMQVQLQEKTSQLSQTTNETYSDLNRLLNLKYTSINNMMTAIIAASEVNDELVALYDSFVLEQNEIATQVTSSLKKIFDDNRIKYEVPVGGGLKVY